MFLLTLWVIKTIFITLYNFGINTIIVRLKQGEDPGINRPTINLDPDPNSPPPRKKRI